MAEEHKFSCSLGLARRFGAPHNLPQPTATASPFGSLLRLLGLDPTFAFLNKGAFLLIGE